MFLLYTYIYIYMVGGAPWIYLPEAASGNRTEPRETGQRQSGNTRTTGTTGKTEKQGKQETQEKTEKNMRNRENRNNRKTGNTTRRKVLRP